MINAPKPAMQVFDRKEQDVEAAGEWLKARHGEGIVPQEIGVFVRSDKEVVRRAAGIERAGLSFMLLDQHVETISGHVSLCTMQLAKGL